MKNQRLMSLDALRGFDMLFIMGFSGLIAKLCALAPGDVTNEIANQMGHVAWDGLAHHDTIFPLFLFLAGVSFPFSLANQRKTGATSWDIHKKILRRMFMLILFGLIYNGLFQLNFAELRCASVLARIGIAWAIAAILFVHFSLRTRIIIATTILLGYGWLSVAVAAPDVPGAIHYPWKAVWLVISTVCFYQDVCYTTMAISTQRDYFQPYLLLLQQC